MNKTVMPPTDKPMTRIEFHVPQPILDDAREVLGDDGWRESEFHRHIWEIGLSAYVEMANKRMEYRKLKKELANDVDH